MAASSALAIAPEPAVIVSTRTPPAVPPGALLEWLALSAVLEESGAVPCRMSDPEAWWPDGNELDSPDTGMAVRACWRCPARVACADYALAADERGGIWGGTLPDERRERCGRSQRCKPC